MEALLDDCSTDDSSTDSPRTLTSSESPRTMTSSESPRSMASYSDWTLWSGSVGDQDVPSALMTCSSERFWECFPMLPNPSSLDSTRAMMIFRQGVRPVAEDAANLQGGSLTIRFPFSDTFEWTLVESVWNDLVHGILNERLKRGKFVNGICIKIVTTKCKRPHVSLELWYSAHADADAVYALRGSFERDVLMAGARSSIVKRPWDYTKQVLHSGTKGKGAPKKTGSQLAEKLQQKVPALPHGAPEQPGIDLNFWQ
eukprot:TRINITY_DN4576_c0_g1_i6.p1 TRINITY_DN4576_c0_g1~~TRINITY_DN4576_c0_g1_i6.p1  ORF type:complete len:276 (+),score=39.99 TRINITY_DN4576_c0_g1_i6:61-828(+)